MDLKHGAVLADKFKVERVLGDDRGTKGDTVVAARQISTGKMVALTIMRPGTSERRLAMRFARAQQIKSVHVPACIDVGSLSDGRPFVAMEYLDGMNLRRFLGRKPVVDIGQAIDYALHACDAIAAAHGVGLVHRRLTTACLFQTTPQHATYVIKVLDFAHVLATGNDAIEDITEYAAPELFDGSVPADRRCDIWSLGIILFELLTGSLPFTARSRDKLSKRVREEAAPPVRSIRREVPEGLDRVILRCLEKSVDQRWQSSAELAQALAPFGTVAARELAARVMMPNEPPREEDAAVRAHGSEPKQRSAQPIRGPLFEEPTGGEEQIGFRRMMADGRIEGLNAESVVEFARGKRVAAQADLLAQGGPRVQTPPVEEDDGGMKAIGGPDDKANEPPPGTPQLVRGSASAPVAPVPSSAAPVPTAAVAPPPPGKGIVGILILAIAVILGLLIGAIWKTFFAPR